MTGEPLELSEARFAVLETLQHGDWQAMPIDGDGSRILIADLRAPGSHASTVWLVTVEPASIAVTPAGLDVTTRDDVLPPADRHAGEPYLPCARDDAHRSHAWIAYGSDDDTDPFRAWCIGRLTPR